MIRFFFPTVFILMVSNWVNAQQQVKLIPQPVSLVNNTGAFKLSGSTTITTDDDEDAKHIALWLSGFLKKSTGYNIPVSQKNGNKGISLTVNKNPDEEIGKEGYVLSVKPEKITLTANSGAGLFYGIQTLIQLLPKEVESGSVIKDAKWEIPSVEIRDYPRFGWRGIMLDVSRHFFTVDEIKKLLDEMARYKFNKFHFHLTDDNGWRVEIKSFPELTKTGAWRVPHTGKWKDHLPAHKNDIPSYGGFYTQDEIREIVRYAGERKIDVLPEIDMPGHSLAAIAAYPYLSCSKMQYQVSRSYPDEDNTFCLANDSTYEFVDKVIGEIAQLFPFEYIHIGGDECTFSFWEQCALCSKLAKDIKASKPLEFQGYFAKRVEKIVRSKGKKIIGWDEIVEGGLPSTSTVMSYRGMDGGIAAAKQQHQVIMTPDYQVYLDIYQGNPAVEPNTFGQTRLKDVYKFEPLPEGVDKKYILGGQGNLWTESVPTFTHAEYMIWPRAFAISEILWSSAGKRNWNDFVNRVEHQMERFSVADINYATSVYDAIITWSKLSSNQIQVQLDTEIDGLDLYYTWDNTLPNHHSPKYKKGETLSVPLKSSMFRVITYRNGKPLGKMISIPIDGGFMSTVY